MAMAAESPDLNSLTSAFAEVFEGLGFGPPTYLDIGEHQGYIAPRYRFGAGCPAWSQRYREKDYLRYDACAAMCTWWPTAFTWTEVEALKKGAGIRKIIGEAREIWAPEMLICPVRSETGGIAAVCLPMRHVWVPTAAERRVAHALAGLYATFGQGLLDDHPQRPIGAFISLTKREQDCLYWVAMGKSDSEIASLLSISHNTAHHQIESAKAKLGASSRIVMARRAAAAGLIIKAR
jgi:LuxR family quorum-sensing system transcriptional regulator CciR